MVIDNLNHLGAAIPPDEADVPLIVDPDAVLSPAIASECLEPVAGGARRSESRVAASSMSSLRSATALIARNAAGVPSRYSASVRRSLNERITYARYNASRYMSSIRAKPSALPTCL